MLINTSKPSRAKIARPVNGHSDQPPDGHSVYTEAAMPVAIGALYSRIEELEARLRKIETANLAGPERKNGKRHSSKNGANGHDAHKTAVVVISSVVATLIDQPHNIISVNPLNSYGSHSACPWALQGRLLLHEARS